MAIPGNYMNAPHWSFSRITKFTACSLQWAFQYYYKLEPEHRPLSLLFGGAFHSAATWIAVNKKDGKRVDVAEAEDFFSECFLKECRSSEDISFGDCDENGCDTLGRSMIACLLDNWPQDETVVDAGVPFRVALTDYRGLPVSDKVLIGEFDLVSKLADGTTAIVDWKTAARKWPVDKASKDFQATCYLYAGWKEMGMDPEQTLFRYDVVTKTAKPAVTRYPTMRKHDHFQRMLKLVGAVENAIKAEAFLPNESSFFCGDCVYAAACSEWHRVQARTISAGEYRQDPGKMEIAA
ncbi:MAG: PD-(D/E)XK nuclease family protein [Victivallales bacterium]